MPLVYEDVLNPDWVKYGIEGAIFLGAMIILFVLYFMIKKGNESFQDQMMQRQTSQEESLAKRQEEQDKRARQQDEKLTQAMDAILKSQSHAHSPQEEDVSSKFTNFVHIGLEMLINNIGCQRAYFVIYHNGAWSNNGISLPKMSMINEAYHDYKMESLMPQLQSIPRGFLPGLDAIFEKEGRVFCKNLEDLKAKDPITYSWLAMHGTKSVVIYPVRDMYKHYNIGFVAVEYYSDFPVGVSDEDIEMQTLKIAHGIASAACFTNEDEKLTAGHINQQ